jgi:hypothetical protein
MIIPLYNPMIMGYPSPNAARLDHFLSPSRAKDNVGDEKEVLVDTFHHEK